jgi:hypothetical protein
MPVTKYRNSPATPLKNQAPTRNALAEKRLVGRRVTLYVLLFFLLMIFSGAIGAGFYLNSIQHNGAEQTQKCSEVNQGLSEIKQRLSLLEDRLDKNKTVSGDEEKDKLLVRAANKYHLVLFAQRIMDNAAKNTSYADSLNELRDFASGLYDRELKVFADASAEITISNSTIIDELRKPESGQNIVLQHQPEGWLDKAKLLFANSFKIRKTEELNPNPKQAAGSIAVAIERITAGHNSEALNILTGLSTKEGNVNFVIKVLKARVDVETAAKKIISDNLR